MQFPKTWIDLKAIILIEVNQTEDKYCMIPYICGIFKKNSANELSYKIKIQGKKFSLVAQSCLTL